MTQAFNLSQFANKVNTSGQADLTTAVTGTLPVSNGGTGASTLTSNNVLLGNGTSAVQTVAPSTSGNVLTSNGTTWTSAPLSYATGFDKSLVTNGYQKLPSGLIIQWQRQNSLDVSTNYTFNYPINFPNSALNIQITSVTNAGTSFVPTIVSFNSSSFTMRWERPSGGDNPANFFIMAIGY